MTSAATFTIPPSMKEQKSYRNFVNTIRSPKTLSNYDYYLKKFMQFHKIKSYDTLLKGDLLLIESRITEWIHEDKSITNTSKGTYLAGIKHFYDMNRCNLAWKIILKHVGEKERSFQDRAYTQGELLKMLNIATLREKVVLTLLASAGLRRQAVPDIKRKHLEKTELGNYKITVYAGTKYEYSAYCSRECARWIDEYFAFRETKGEKFSSDAPLLREEFDIADNLRAAIPRKVTEHTIINIFKSLTARTGIRSVTHLIEGQEKFRSAMRKDVMLTHGCRKFCNTMMVKAKVYPITKEQLLGHSAGLDKSYLRPSDEDVLNEYMKAEQLLTIDPTARQAVKIKQLESEKDNLIKALEKRLKNVEESLVNRTANDFPELSTDPEKLQTNERGYLTPQAREQILKSLEERRHYILQMAERDPSQFEVTETDI